LTLDPPPCCGNRLGGRPDTSNMGRGISPRCTPPFAIHLVGISSKCTRSIAGGSSLEQTSLMLYYSGDNTVFTTRRCRRHLCQHQSSRRPPRRHPRPPKIIMAALKPADPLGQDIAVSRAAELLKSVARLSRPPQCCRLGEVGACSQQTAKNSVSGQPATLSPRSRATPLDHAGRRRHRTCHPDKSLQRFMSTMNEPDVVPPSSGKASKAPE